LSSSLTINFHGHACFELQAGGVSVLIDPFLAPNNPVAKVSAEDLSPAHVVITHGHVDHIADALPIATREGVTSYAIVEIANWLNERGANTVDLNLGGHADFEGGSIGLVQAFHTNTLPDGTVIGQAAGAIVKMGGHTVYHVGDSALFGDMALISELEGVDTLIVPIGDHYTMGIDAAVRATGLVKPRHVIPCHYNTFPPIQVDASRFAAGVAALGGVEAHVMEPGETVTI
jgi:L-ascorbate metabolism protein UlaG (beta-lactamase superfamily)